MDKKTKNSEPKKELSSTAIMGQPENAFELVNKYGTYEIQPTNDSDNEYPTIAQGLPNKVNKDKSGKGF